MEAHTPLMEAEGPGPRHLLPEWPYSLWIGGSILIVHLVIAATGQWWAPFGTSQMGTGAPLSGPSWHHLFGTDQLGRDVFSRVVHGAPLVILLSLSGTVLGLLSGATIGLVSGFVKGWVDAVLTRVLEALISIPFIILALLIVSLAGPQWSGSPLLVVLVVAFIYLPRIARMARAAALEISMRDYVAAARLRGENNLSP